MGLKLNDMCGLSHVRCAKGGGTFVYLLRSRRERESYAKLSHIIRSTMSTVRRSV